MSAELYFAYLLACVVLTLVPGPTVALIIANSLSHGTRAGLLNVAGTQLGLALMMAVLALGLASVVEFMGLWFDWLRLAGAAYLIWLGWRIFRSGSTPEHRAPVRPPRGGFFLQGFLVMMSNPKALLFFGAFIPQFVDPRGDTVMQVALLGATAMAIAAITDSIYALLTGRAGALITERRVRLASKLSGAVLIGGGVWLALARSR